MSLPHLNRESFIELPARDRAKRLLDPGSFRELLGPFDRLKSPWLERQDIVAQSDDGVVVAKGTLDGHDTVVAAIEGAYQGGSIGEVGGTKIAAALELAAHDNREGRKTGAVLMLETGGVRLQEANLGLAAIAQIHAAIVDLRRYQAVIGIITGPVGCYGGMSIAAGLCSYLLVTREARLGLNGPAVIEQEAGLAELDARDKATIWGLTGGEQRFHTGLADACTVDDAEHIRQTVAAWLRQGPPRLHRSENYRQFLACLDTIDLALPVSPETVRNTYTQTESP